VELLEDRRLLSTNVLTFHNDALRTGANLTETTLTPANVGSGSFGQVASYPVDGQIYAQPLYLANLTMPDGSVHNVVFVETEHDSAYAFDANGGGLLWQTSYIDPANNINPASSADLSCNSQISPEVGITDTPAIDPNTGTMYFVTETEDTSSPGNPVYHQTLHAVDITTGNDVLPPMEIQAAVLGTGDAAFGSPNIVRFQPGQEKERVGLFLLNGIVWTSWTSNCDHTPSHGWVLGYDTQTLQQVQVFNPSPNGQLASIWGGDAPPAIDANGKIYFVTGNGAFSGNDFNQAQTYPETVLKLSVGSNEPSVADTFTPYNWSALDQADRDFGSGSVMLLPDQAGPIPHLLVAAGKEGKIYLLNRDNLGGYNGLYDNVWQEIPGALAGGGAYDAPVYFSAGGSNRRWIYYAAQNDTLKAFELTDSGTLLTSPTSHSTHVFTSLHGATPSVSANGTSNGIVWIIDPNTMHAQLLAYDATDLSAPPLFDSNANPADQLDGGIKFSLPTIADGQVFVGTADTLTVFGLLPGPSARLSPAALLTGTVGQASAQGQVPAVSGGSTLGAAPTVPALPDNTVAVPAALPLGTDAAPLVATLQPSASSGADNPLSGTLPDALG
jgi:hypothetical protein